MKRVFFILIALLLLPAGCKDGDEDMQKYLQPFLGKWKEIGCGNDRYPELTPDGHVIEFLPDGTFIRGTGTDPYWADAELLYTYSGKSPDGYTWRYTFTGTDTLRLDYVDGLISESMGTPHFYIYERLKTNEL
jgi:hypothetical protein